MKKSWKKFVSLALSAALLLSHAPTAWAAFEDFKDVNGHWAQTTLRQAYQDGILKGYSSSSMRPNDSVTTAQAATILCRVFGVSRQADPSKLKIPDGAWYKEDAARALYFGILDDRAVGTMDCAISRADAFRMFAAAFQLTKAAPDDSVLAKFSDTELLTGEERRAAASLVQDGILIGSGGKLLWDKTLTRAEFVTILYRLVNQYLPADSYKSGSAILSGDAALRGVRAGWLWFDSSSSSVSLTDVTADAVTVRADVLSSMQLSGTGRIGRLTLGNASGDVNLQLPETYRLGTLKIGDGAGAVSFDGAADSVEVTGNGRTLTLMQSTSTLVVSGNNNTICIDRNCTLGTILISGKNNAVKLDGKTDLLQLKGRDNKVTGRGNAANAELYTRYYELSVSKGKLTRWSNYDIDRVDVRVDAPDQLKAGETLQAAAELTVPEEDRGKICIGTWYLNGTILSQEKLVLGKTTPTLSSVLSYTHNMNLRGVLTFELEYENSDGDVFTRSGSDTIRLETYADLGLADAEVSVQVPETLPPGEPLTARAVVKTPEKGKVCTGCWYVDGAKVAEHTLVLGKEPTELVYRYDYYYGMPETSTIAYRLTYTTQDGRKQEVRGEAATRTENYPDNGIAHASVTLNAPGTLEAGAALQVTAQIQYPEAGKNCTGTWYIDGQPVSVQNVVLGSSVPKLNYKFTYTETMKTTAVVKFELCYTTQDGRAQKISAAANVTLKNYDYVHYHGVTKEYALRTVTGGYAGNYTLNWAKTHDYSQEVKRVWVNAKGYSSKTQYLIWVSLKYQRVNVFKGSKGNWALIRECLCGSGKASTPTIQGVFTTSYKQPLWDYGEYYCGPIVRFNGSSGYAFHSRLQYYPVNSGRYYDARIGFPVSHGCLRMYNEDIQWIYNNIPNGTTVVVY